MLSNSKVNQLFQPQLNSLRARGRAFARAFKVRADIAAVRRRLRLAQADLGKAVYEKLDQIEALAADEDLATGITRIKGLEAELRQCETALRRILEVGNEKVEPADSVGPDQTTGKPDTAAGETK